MSNEIELELLDKARLLVADRESGDLVIHFTTEAGVEHYFGMTLRGGIELVAQWGRDVRQVCEALQSDGEITGHQVVPPKATAH